MGKWWRFISHSHRDAWHFRGFLFLLRLSSKCVTVYGDTSSSRCVTVQVTFTCQCSVVSRSMATPCSVGPLQKQSSTVKVSKQQCYLKTKSYCKVPICDFNNFISFYSAHLRIHFLIQFSQILKNCEMSRRYVCPDVHQDRDVILRSLEFKFFIDVQH